MKIPLDHLNCTLVVNLAFIIYESEAIKQNKFNERFLIKNFVCLW